MDSDKILSAIERRDELRTQYDEEIIWAIGTQLRPDDPVSLWIQRAMDLIEDDMRGLLFALITGETVYLNGSARKALEKLEK